MRSLAIVLYADKPVPIPLSYNALIQGALYDGWKEHRPDLHSQGFNSSDKTYRLFTFSQLSGKAKIDRTKKTIAFEGSISLSVRSAFFARFQIIFGKGIDKVPKTWYHIRAFKICGCSSVVEHQPSKLVMWVRFPSPAPLFEERTRCSAASHTQKNVRHFLSGMPEFLPTRDFMYL